MRTWRKAAGYLTLLLALVLSSGCAEPKQLQLAPSALQSETISSAPLVYAAAQHRVVRVRDGDSLTLSSDQVVHEVRLAGIDAPELRQEYGAAAKEALTNLVREREITFRDEGQDRYHRNLVRLYADGIDVNREMVRSGHAWWYRNYSKDPDLQLVEQEARSFRRGLWSRQNPQPPWEWRHASRPSAISSGG